jgi:hypothetical protein
VSRENSGLVQITKATRAKPAEPMKTLNSSNDPHGLKRLEKTRAQTPEGIMRVANKILCEAMEGPLAQKPGDDSSTVKGPKYAEQRCKTIDPNCYGAPFNRIRSPREMRNRRPEGWQNGRIVLPKVTIPHAQSKFPCSVRCASANRPDLFPSSSLALGPSILRRLKGAGVLRPAPVFVEVVLLSGCALLLFPPFIGSEHEFISAPLNPHPITHLSCTGCGGFRIYAK